ncbi:MAG: excalibur calcium-binding domain-containing protein [Dokdonella sp.]
MRKLLLFLILVTAAWYGYGKHEASTRIPAPRSVAVVADESGESAATAAATATATDQFTCDGRQHCSQMRSCAEATYFIQHCPNTKMDGDRDGVPCENQWCR